MTKPIKRFHSQYCIGWQRNRPGVLDSVIEAEVEYKEGSFGRVWGVAWGNNEAVGAWSDQKPRVDVPNEGGPPR